ncbi:tRNA (adenosine(37)-N6)-threonylcarbamoyltransferase complex dimerization subunit type 1 TsaB [Aquabacterium sp. OR-4]|uniref:tRNA (adenosine(37)-N6)-threonylcarbamoyltransferase complex dimerization subunit type 1 TsaB n=1 Tax=Aquabacterium sp. OR-4 TaxID=2978127 RepID=UPI0021B1FD26|nr:tRNA (adenosine(37)-N6)-threonylcarbamoyltransferase complex dimerization subunit type 1 TsaB [Aquabacterium sp. OR-4]MDT7837422.1 tRNA (adenosine(37)-N6)-threonylcarbamoyltransferase complex dimerization subunit type 1 TsaB [Aquabacterium sp. OR-4]
MTERPPASLPVRPPARAPGAAAACLLALDTATECLAVGLCTPQGRWLQHEAGGAQASARLVPVVMDLLRQAGTSLAGLDAIAFGVGPGAFTGLRTACAVAQGLGFGADRPLLPVDSLLIVAESARAEQASAGQPDDGTGAWWVAVDARMDEVYAAEYHFDAAEGWHTRQAPALYTQAALAERWARAQPQRVAGNAPRLFGARLPVQGVRCIEPAEHPAQAQPAAQGAGGRAGALLRLAGAAWARGAQINADQALPLYLRDKVALTTDERLRQRAAAAGAP